MQPDQNDADIFAHHFHKLYELLICLYWRISWLYAVHWWSWKVWVEWCECRAVASGLSCKICTLLTYCLRWSRCQSLMYRSVSQWVSLPAELIARHVPIIHSQLYSPNEWQIHNRNININIHTLIITRCSFAFFLARASFKVSSFVLCIIWLSVVTQGCSLGLKMFLYILFVSTVQSSTFAMAPSDGQKLTKKLITNSLIYLF